MGKRFPRLVHPVGVAMGLAIVHGIDGGCGGACMASTADAPVGRSRRRAGGGRLRCYYGFRPVRGGGRHVVSSCTGLGGMPIQEERRGR